MKSLASLILLVFVFQLNAQQNLNQKVTDNTVVMTWNKNTHEQEMKEDIKALKTNNGITIKYSNLKHNLRNEITNLKIEYADNEGNSGSQEYNNKNAIPEIKFYKINGEIGFGNPNNQSSGGNGMAFQNFDLNDLQNQFSNKIKIDTLGNNKTFSFDFNDNDSPKINKKSKIIIQKDGRKPLVIEDGKVITGENDYTKEEIEKIQNDNKINDLNDKKSLNFNFNGTDFDMKNLQEQIEKLQNQFQNTTPKFGESKDDSGIIIPTVPDKENLKKEMRDARNEIFKAKKEPENAKKEIHKSGNQMKTQRI